MSRLFSGAPTAPRTDSQGRFAVEIYFSLPDFPADQLHVASPDFRHQALQVVRADGPDQPLEITLKPTRSVRARVVETPKDYPRTPLSWQVYSVDPTGTNAYDIYAISGKGALWSSGSIFPEDRVPAGGKRQLEVQLSAGHYKVVLDTFTTYRVIDLVVPEGEGPLELPEIDLANFAWVKMLGRPAAEIEATDLEGRPVKLADHRGKVVLLTFGVAWDDPSRVKALDRLVEFHKRFKDQPLSIFMLHDASISSAEALKRADGPFFDRYFKLPDTPFVLLLDRPPVGNGTGPIERRAGESESGRTSDRYEVVAPSTFVIDKQGRLASALVENLQGVRTFAIGKDGELVQEFEDDSGREPESENFMHMFSIEKLVASLEDQLGLPRTPRPKRPPRPSSPFDSEPPGTAPRPPDGPVVVTGKVIDPDGKPVAGAMVLPSRNTPEKEVKTDPTGAFSFTIDDLRGGLSLKLEAPGLATRTFWIHRVGEGKSQVPFDVTKWSIEPSGLIGRPLLMGQGAVVTGRVVRDGKPVSGISMILKFRDDLPDIEAKTDDQGHFRMARVATGQEPEQAIYSKPGSLPDHQTVIPRTFKAGLDGATVDLGDFEVQPGRTLAGRVIVSDGKPLDRHAKVMVQRDNLPEFSAVMDEAGRFEIKGIPDGHVSIYMMGITGYRLSPRNKCLDPTNPNHLAGMIIRDITDLTILIQPGLAPERGTLTTDELDPALVADFEDAKAGPIMGIAPGEAPKNQ